MVLLKNKEEVAWRIFCWNLNAFSNKPSITKNVTSLKLSGLCMLPAKLNRCEALEKLLFIKNKKNALPSGSFQTHFYFIDRSLQAFPLIHILFKLRLQGFVPLYAFIHIG